MGLDFCEFKVSFRPALGGGCGAMFNFNFGCGGSWTCFLASERRSLKYS